LAVPTRVVAISEMLTDDTTALGVEHL